MVTISSLHHLKIKSKYCYLPNHCYKLVPILSIIIVILFVNGRSCEKEKNNRERNEKQKSFGVCKPGDLHFNSRDLDFNSGPLLKGSFFPNLKVCEFPGSRSVERGQQGTFHQLLRAANAEAYAKRLARHMKGGEETPSPSLQLLTNLPRGNGS